MEAQSLPDEGSMPADYPEQSESACLAQAREDLAATETTNPTLGTDVTTETAGEEPEVATGDDGAELFNIITTIQEEDGEGDIKAEEEEGLLDPNTLKWEGYRPAEESSAERVEAELTMAEQLEAELTMAEQLEAELTMAEQLEAELTMAEPLEAELTMAGQLEAELNTSETLEAEQRKLLNDLRAERDQLGQQNSQLQLRLLHHFRRKSSDEPRPEPGMAEVFELEQRYLKLLDTMEDLRLQQHLDSELYLQQAEELQQQSQEKVEQGEQVWTSWAEARCEAAVAVLTRTLGRQPALVQAEKIGASARKREEDLVAVRMKNIKLKMKVQKLEAMLKEKEELDEGMNVIDFEQLKIENQTYSEKIEERNEELLKLRKKIGSTVQVLSHVKEKLQFVQVENRAKQDRRDRAEAGLARGRDALTRTKQARDALRADNLRLYRLCGLQGNAKLLRDFEEKVDACRVLEEQLEKLKRRHAELSVRGAGVRRKVEKSRAHAHTP